MKKERIQIGFDTFTISVFKSTIRGAGRNQERWELNITNQYDSQLLHSTLEGNLAEFVQEKTGLDPESLLIEFARTRTQELGRKTRGV